jgi:hypothetical protein
MEEKQMQDKPLNEEDSLALISQMIRNTRRRLEKGAGEPMLVWGYATIIAAFAVWIAFRMAGNYHWNYLWFLIPAIGFPYTLLRKRRPKEVRTYVDKVIGYIWTVLGLTGFLLSMMSILNVMWPFPILFIIILVMGMGSILTGLVIGFKPSVIGGIVGMVIGTIHHLIGMYDIKMVTFVLAFVVMFIIPGHILNHRAKKYV